VCSSEIVVGEPHALPKKITSKLELYSSSLAAWYTNTDEPTYILTVEVDDPTSEHFEPVSCISAPEGENLIVLCRRILSGRHQLTLASHCWEKKGEGERLYYYYYYYYYQLTTIPHLLAYLLCVSVPLFHNVWGLGWSILTICGPKMAATFSNQRRDDYFHFHYMLVICV